ncbi:MAG: DUF4115 domain-containing protein [Gallionella sp.]|nr:DUF4115 domain-containing protein [Gallionella sp.]
MTEPTAVQTVPASVGSLLRAAREAQGLTVADVAERIKFSVRQVEALEADKNEALPEGAFLRGFVRSYARTLHLDEIPLLAMMSPSHIQHGDVSDVQAGGSEFPTSQASNKKNIYLLGGALVMAAMLGLFVWSQQKIAVVEKVVIEEVNIPEMIAASAPLPSSGVVAASAVDVTVGENKIVQTTPPSTVVMQPKALEIVKPVAAPAKTVVPPAVPVPPTKPKQVTPSPTASASSNAVGEKSTTALDQLKKRPIHIVFAEDSWMEIVDTSGEVLLSRMNLAGTEKWIGGGRRAPYKVAIGKAAAVKIFYKGREVDLTKYNQTGVVRLVLE